MKKKLVLLCALLYVLTVMVEPLVSISGTTVSVRMNEHYKYHTIYNVRQK